MIPGMGKAMKNIDIDDDAFKHIEAIIHSMTKQERENPEIINGSRKKRIATGCGRDITEINRLMKQFDDMKKMMKVMQNPGGRRNMMNMMRGM
jgi:signal recognition particle subunit SRP54